MRQAKKTTNFDEKTQSSTCKKKPDRPCTPGGTMPRQLVGGVTRSAEWRKGGTGRGANVRLLYMQKRRVKPGEKKKKGRDATGGVKTGLKGRLRAGDSGKKHVEVQRGQGVKKGLPELKTARTTPVREGVPSSGEDCYWGGSLAPSRWSEGGSWRARGVQKKCPMCEITTGRLRRGSGTRASEEPVQGRSVTHKKRSSLWQIGY